MGVLDPGLICPSDGLDYIDSPGYFGHIKLARPVYYIQYLGSIQKILRCVCLKCSKVLINKDKHNHLLELPNDQRWNKIFALASKKKRCGEDSHNGCGCLQPKIKKEGLSTIVAEWNSTEEELSNYEFSKINNNKLIMKLTPEIVLKIFKKISSEDIKFLGFDNVWSKPEWMICQVMAVPPPSMRPSVKHDIQQRSEDDLTHIIINIIKSNKTLGEKIEQKANNNVIDDWTTVLQYYVATLIDNKIPGVAAVAQRSGRPLKAIKERLNGKTGRVRGNLMGKRVDFSARSVITPDPNLSIVELGIPLKIAKNLSKPITVNKRNKSYLKKLVINGPDVYPGAKIYEKKNGETISLRYVDRESIILEDGDVVHRHLLNNDNVLFNRQPTLHRMSMMCHKAVIMYKGDTFRLNVADTKPYNADFDGDEMNLHVAQDDESEIELMELAAVKNQIISPANNKSIIGIFQDSLLSSYLFTNNVIEFDNRIAMNLLMHNKNINLNLTNFKKKLTNFEILSTIMPNLSLHYKTNQFKDDEEDVKTSNNILEIKNGKIIRGVFDKNVLGDTTRGLLHRITNDYSNTRSYKFIDDFQNIITEYMKLRGYSVGISDLIADKDTNDAITKAITQKKIEVKSLIDEIHLGIFENKSGKSNNEEFELKVNNILNKASFDAGKIGRESLSTNNRFVTMVNAGSKGSDLNISQMISCLGQQNVDGKRIPYGFQNRTLPHYCKFDDSPEARGFVENSFISGLSPAELFFHAMGGRVGLIDTAVKTSTTGYIQRRLIKALEDLMVGYDMTVRNNKFVVIQFKYGDDGFDPVKIESQNIEFVYNSIEEIYTHYQMPDDSTKNSIYETIYTKDTYKRFKKQKEDLVIKTKKYIDYILGMRKEIIENSLENIHKTSVNVAVSFINILNNIAGYQQDNTICDITPLEIFELLEKTIEKLDLMTYNKPTELFKTLYYYYLSPKTLLLKKKLTKKNIIYLLDMIVLYYKKALVTPGEMVGMIAAQSIGEPTTQLTLNTFHYAGVASKSNVTRGVPRIEEIMTLSENPKNPSCTIYLKDNDKYDQNIAKEYIYNLEHTKLSSLVEYSEIYFDPNDNSTIVSNDLDLNNFYNEFESMLDECTTKIDEKEKSKWIIRFVLNKEKMLDSNINMEEIDYAIKESYNNVLCMFSDYNSDNLIFRIRMTKAIDKKKNKQQSLDQSDELYVLKNLQHDILNNLVVRGVKNISKVIIRKITDNIEFIDDSYKKKEIWVLDTVGTNLLDILSLNFIDKKKTYCNDIQEIYTVLGIEAARQSIFNEFSEVIEFDSTYINYRHLTMLADRMTYTDKMISVFRHGINNDNIGPIAKASFEETPEMFLKAARHGELDNMRGVSANVMCGQEGYYGTSSFNVLLDNDELMNKEAPINDDDNNELTTTDEKIEKEFNKNIDYNKECSFENLHMNDIDHIKEADYGSDNDYNIF
jgi:DNA-directed RNA polymerase II subunit RPB1